MDQMVAGNPRKIRQFAASEILCNIRGSLLGRGGFGTVRLGHHQVLGRLAIKCQHLQGSLVEMRQAKKELLKEVKMMLLAAHKHVIRIEGLINEEDWIGVVMEHMSAGSLSDLIFNEELETIPLPLLLRMSYETADAITYLHKMLKDLRIAHGDLKPQNILLNSDLHCKVADFGGAALSHHTRTATARPDRTGEGNQFTLLFTAPERLDRNCERLTTSMDVYSFGVILYMMIVRKYPGIRNEILFRMTGKFQGVSFQQKLINDIKDRLKRGKDEQGVRIISLLESIMTKCVDKEPSKRPAMIEIRDQLHQLLATIKPSTIMLNIASVLEHVTITDDTLDEGASKPISHVILGVDESTSKTSRKTKSSLESFTTSSTTSTSSTLVGAIKGVAGLKVSDPLTTSKNQSGYEIIQSKIRSMRDMISNENFDRALAICEELTTAMKSSSITGDDAINTGDDIINLVSDLRKHKVSLQLLQLFKCGCYLKEKIINPRKKLELMKKIAVESYVIVQSTSCGSDLAQTASNEIIPRMNEFLQSISSTRCDDVKLVTTTQVHCWKAIGLCHYHVQKYKEAIEVNKLAITILESKLGEGCRKLEVYSICCNNAGAYYEFNNQPDDSETFYIKAFQAEQKVEDYPSEEWRMKMIHFTIDNVCNLYQNHSTMTKTKGNDVYKFLQKQLHLTGFPHFKNKFLTLRLMILLSLDDDVKFICNSLATMATDITPSPGECNNMCIRLKQTAELLFSKNDENSAMTLIRCGMKLSEFIPDADDELYRLRDFADAMAKQASKLTSLSPSHLVTIAGGFIPLCEEIIEKIKRSKNVDQQIKDKWLSLTLNHTSHCYLTIKLYDKALQLANQAMDILPLDIGQHQNLRDKFKGEMYYCIGVSNYNLEKFNSAKNALSEAIKLLKNWSGQNDRLKEARRYLEKINNL
ncbi:uncharacterized protein LOC143471078 isoform X1 [Clavelina lepadiformis]|uniref:uncharacterized protein LOC143471078 isoform X1 n=1 Tax=Clavelina lepadiformis TaxID=159417 RepID=UPI00404192DA